MGKLAAEFALPLPEMRLGVTALRRRNAPLAAGLNGTYRSDHALISLQPLERPGRRLAVMFRGRVRGMRFGVQVKASMSVEMAEGMGFEPTIGLDIL